MGKLAGDELALKDVEANMALEDAEAGGTPPNEPTGGPDHEQISETPVLPTEVDDPSLPRTATPRALLTPRITPRSSVRGPEQQPYTPDNRPGSAPRVGSSTRRRSPQPQIINIRLGPVAPKIAPSSRRFIPVRQTN